LGDAHPPKEAPAPAWRDREAIIKAVSCLVLGMVLSIILLLLMMQSSDRGQVLFAVLMSFVLGVTAAHQVFPTPLRVVALVIPAATAVVFYLLFGCTSVGGVPDAWTRVQPYAYALPIDWMTVGEGGALLGYWVSQRIHEIRHFEKAQKGN
jgi:hypothetical protein